VRGDPARVVAMIRVDFIVFSHSLTAGTLAA
jgi:hypothetical protein